MKRSTARATVLLLGMTVLALVALVTNVAHADVTISTGGLKGTYFKFAKDIQAVCEDKVKINILESTGSDQNLQRIMKKESPAADAGFVQTDALLFESLNNPDAGENDIKTLLVLYPEELHVVAANDLKVGGMLGFGGKPPTDVTQLQGKKVGAWGGSYTTAKAMNVQAVPGLDVVPFNNEKEAIVALDTGKVAALVRVSGQPDDWFRNLAKGKYALLEVPANVSARTPMYVATKLNYPGYGTVQSMASMALLVVRNYKTAAKRQELSALKQCVLDNLDELKEGNDYHAKWKAVNPQANSARSFYETVTSATPAAPATPAKKK